MPVWLDRTAQSTTSECLIADLMRNGTSCPPMAISWENRLETQVLCVGRSPALVC